MFQDVNILAIVLATVINIILGSIWYGPLFGRRWLIATNRDPGNAKLQAEMKKAMAPAMTLMLIFTVVTGLVLSVFLQRYVGDFQGSLLLGLMLWLGFLLPVKINQVFFGGSQKALLWIDGAWLLLSTLVMTSVIHFWR